MVGTKENPKEGDLYECSSESTEPCTNHGHSKKGFFVVTDSKLPKQFIKCNGTKCVLKEYSNNSDCKSTDEEETFFYSYYTNYFCDLNHNKYELKKTSAAIRIGDISKDIEDKYTGDYAFINITSNSITMFDPSLCKKKLLFLTSLFL